MNGGGKPHFASEHLLPDPGGGALAPLRPDQCADPTVGRCPA